MEFWQIVINIAVLTVLFVWVWMGATKVFARRTVVELMIESIKHQQDEHNQKLGQDFLDVFHILENRISGIQATQKPKKVPGEAYLSAIREGASLAQANFTIGAQTVLDALHRDGRIAATDAPAKPEGATNIGEEDYEIHNENPALPSIIVARNQRMAEQIGDRLAADIMRGMDEKV